MARSKPSCIKSNSRSLKSKLNSIRGWASKKSYMAGSMCIMPKLDGSAIFKLPCNSPCACDVASSASITSSIIRTDC